MISEVKQSSLAAAMTPLYAAAISMVTALQIRFAMSLHSIAAAAESVTTNTNTPSSQFTSRAPRRWDDSPAATNHNTISKDAPCIYQMNNRLSRVWSTLQCDPMQVVATKIIVFGKECGEKL